MTNADKIIDALTRGGEICDDCLSKKTGILPRQQVNQICRRIESSGELNRENDKCSVCSGKKIVNSLLTNLL